MDTPARFASQPRLGQQTRSLTLCMEPIPIANHPTSAFGLRWTFTYFFSPTYSQRDIVIKLRLNEACEKKVGNTRKREHTNLYTIKFLINCLLSDVKLVNLLSAIARWVQQKCLCSNINFKLVSILWDSG